MVWDHGRRSKTVSARRRSSVKTNGSFGASPTPLINALLSTDPMEKFCMRIELLLEYSGLSVEDVMADDFRARLVHPDDFERSRDERRHALERGTPFELELRARRKDGQYRWFLIRYNPLRDEEGRIIRWYSTGTDIDDRKRDEERIQKENLALREEIDHSSMFEEIVGSSDVIRKRIDASHQSGAVGFHGARAG